MDGETLPVGPQAGSQRPPVQPYPLAHPDQAVTASLAGAPTSVPLGPAVTDLDIEAVRLVVDAHLDS